MLNIKVTQDTKFGQCLCPGAQNSKKVQELGNKRSNKTTEEKA